MLNSLEDVDVEVLAEAAGVVVEDGFGIPKTLQDWKDLHGLMGEEKETSESQAKAAERRTHFDPPVGVCHFCLYTLS